MLLAPYQSRLHSLRIVLASQSPRRRELLERCGLAFEVVPSTFEETLDKAEFATPVRCLARRWGNYGKECPPARRRGPLGW